MWQAMVRIHCSIKEQGLYDYVIFNDDLDEAYAQLATVARRALAGQSGNGSGSIAGPVTLVAEEEAPAAQPASGGDASAVRAWHLPLWADRCLLTQGLSHAGPACWRTACRLSGVTTHVRLVPLGGMLRESAHGVNRQSHGHVGMLG